MMNNSTDFFSFLEWLDQTEDFIDNAEDTPENRKLLVRLIAELDQVDAALQERQPVGTNERNSQ